MKDPRFKKLSDRALNVLVLNRLDDIYLMIEHYKREGHFLTLRQCGPITNEKIVAFCQEMMLQEIRNQQVEAEDAQEEETAEETVTGEVAEGAAEVIPEAETVFLEMSDRARNTLLRNGIVGMKSMIEYYKRNNSFDQLSHCGPVTCGELNDCCDRILNDFGFDKNR